MLRASMWSVAGLIQVQVPRPPSEQTLAALVLNRL